MMQINQKNFEQLHQLTPKRIYLPEANVLKKSDGKDYYGTLNFSFKETIQEIFRKDTGFTLSDNSNDPYRTNIKNTTSVWYSIREDSEFNTIKEWIDRQGTTVFIRSLLRLCIALDFNIDMKKRIKTEVGDLEGKAKHQQNEEAVRELTDLFCRKIETSAFYKDATYIVAVPANDDKKNDLPRLLVRRIAQQLNFQNLTDNFSYFNQKKELKSVSITDKWKELEQSNLQFEKHDLSDKPVILLDDKYQSGATMHYVASELNEAGCNEIYGLVAVKTMKDDDNQ